MPDKRALRREIRQRRQTRSVQQLSESAQALGDQWPGLVCLAGTPDLVLGFQPTQFEPDPRPLISQALGGSLPVLLPRPLGTEYLEWVLAKPHHLSERLQTIPTPAGPSMGIGVEPFAKSRTLMLVPALAVDPETGIRLGHGGGYYDRLLAEVRQGSCEVTTVALVFSDELLALPAEAHDQPVDAVLTEDGLVQITSD